MSLTPAYLVIDIATAAIEGAADYLEAPSAPSNYKDQVKIDAWIADARVRSHAKAACDVSLARISAIGTQLVTDGTIHPPVVQLCPTAEEEEAALVTLGLMIAGADRRNASPSVRLCGFGIFGFDLPMLAYRARMGYGRPWPDIETRLPHRDLLDDFSHRRLDQRHALDHYVRLQGWPDLLDKPMSGAEEARIFEHQEWSRLANSVRRDLTATSRLAERWGVFGTTEAVVYDLEAL